MAGAVLAVARKPLALGAEFLCRLEDQLWPGTGHGLTGAKMIVAVVDHWKLRAPVLVVNHSVGR